jgi:DNA-directed RNA polymerase subunit M/transcription elongation factor TFIIS
VLQLAAANMADDDRHTSMQFCQECNNLMYPREVQDPDDPQNSRLVYVCKAPNCVVSSRARADCMEAESTMVWKHVVQHSMRTDDLVNADIIQDPTLPRTNGVACPEVSRAPALTALRGSLSCSVCKLQGCKLPPAMCRHGGWRLTISPLT